jgi:DNA repair protein RadA/Sms
VKVKRTFSCQQCGGQTSQWAGQCPQCHGWNSLVEEASARAGAFSHRGRKEGYAGAKSNSIKELTQIELPNEIRVSTGFAEFDRVLGGGVVQGGVVLLGGDPGIGKSTLVLQALCHLSQTHPVLYITGEESLAQVALRAQRLGLAEAPIHLLAETHVESILAAAEIQKPAVMVIDSIQTVYTDALQSAPGSVGQVRESAAQLVRFAKLTGTTIFFIGHVTKEGALAGPRVLEHMVDTVLYFEGEQDQRFRLVRAIKNRFGTANELGIFAMTERGLRPVNNPSSIFLSRAEQPVPGSVTMVAWEGTRPLLVEVQALVDQSHLPTPRRLTVGIEGNRLVMLLAVLHRHAGIVTYDQDVFLNVVGGVKVTETAADLAVLLAVYSSLRNRPLPHDLIVFGEVGLSGEIRPIARGQERLKEMIKHGFKKAIVPALNAPKQEFADSGCEIIAVSHIKDALDVML